MDKGILQQIDMIKKGIRLFRYGFKIFALENTKDLTKYKNEGPKR